MAFPPTLATALLRGIRRRCARCGARGIFATRFRLRDRCPTCGHLLVREEGAFTMVMLLNVVVTFTLMFVSLASYVAWRGITGDHIALWPFGLACLVSATVVPLLFYPLAWSLWSAFDLVVRPLDDTERLAADTHAAGSAP